MWTCCVLICCVVIFNTLRRDNPSQWNVTSQSDDAQKETRTALYRRYTSVASVRTLADSHPIIVLAALSQTTGKWRHSQRRGIWGQWAVCYDGGTLIVYWFTITQCFVCLGFTVSLVCECVHICGLVRSVSSVQFQLVRVVTAACNISLTNAHGVDKL